MLGAFGDKHAGSHASLWDMVLNFLKAFPRAWHQVDVRKAFLPKLYSFLRSVQLRHPSTPKHCMAGAAVRLLHGNVCNSTASARRHVNSTVHWRIYAGSDVSWGGGFMTDLHQPITTQGSCQLL